MARATGKGRRRTGRPARGRSGCRRHEAGEPPSEPSGRIRMSRPRGTDAAGAGADMAMVFGAVRGRAGRRADARAAGAAEREPRVTSRPQLGQGIPPGPTPTAGVPPPERSAPACACSSRRDWVNPVAARECVQGAGGASFGRLERRARGGTRPPEAASGSARPARGAPTRAAGIFGESFQGMPPFGLRPAPQRSAACWPSAKPPRGRRGRPAATRYARSP